MNPLVAGPGVGDRSSYTSYSNADRGLRHCCGLLASHRRLEGSVGEETRGVHLCHSTESADCEYIGDFVAQSQHSCFTEEAKVTPKMFVWHVKRDLNIPPALVVSRVQVAKRHSEGIAGSAGTGIFPITFVTGPFAGCSAVARNQFR
ncbi:hypothetical protein MRX96_040317 [Rhipicephalus microplus]